MLLFEQLRPKLNYLDDSQVEQIYQAFLVAKDAHFGQKRDSGEEYLSHPIAVADILADMHMDHQSIIAALLHDVIEDTALDKKFIVNKFGQMVADLVDGLTKLTQMEFTSKAEAQAESFRKMVLAMSRDIRVILVKLADRLHNMRTLSGVSVEKQKRIAKETLDIYAPIANRLGMHEISIELESLAFPFVYPNRYQVLKESIEKNRGNRKEIMATIDRELRQGLQRGNLQEVELLGREKHLYGIYKKMLHRHLSFAEIMDVYAFRIIVNSIDECYRVLGIVHGLYKPIPGKFKDYIAIPKFNGYQSLHTTLCGPYSLPIEVQIRTKEMDQMANSGIASHWLYKSGETDIDASHIRAQQWVNNLLEIQQNTGNSLEFLENVKVDLFPDEVYVFTPKGTIMEMPRGSTAVDFAYMVHTDIGNHCVAARIDRQFASLSSVLINGQTVSIITSPEAKPNPSWLNFVVTSRAKSGIKNFLKSQKRDEAIALGKQLFGKALADIELSFYQIPPQVLTDVYKDAKVKTLDDLYEKIGLGNLFAMFVAHQIVNAMKDKNYLVNGEKEILQKPLSIKGAAGVAITFAPCCYPIPGDAIIGYFNVGQGLSIHKDTCETMAKLNKHPENCIAVTWDENIQEDFMAAISVEIKHQRGALALVAQAISNGGSFISDISMTDTSSGYCILYLKIMVKNKDHLERILQSISLIPLVIGVSRQ